MNLIRRPYFYIISPIVITLIIYGYILLTVLKLGYSFSSFIYAGDQFVEKNVPIDILINKPGYDGQFYYALATEPFTNTNPVNGVTLDKPHYRQQRIIYPLLVHFLSFGKTENIPITMIVVNLVSICVLAGFGSIYAIQIGKSYWFGLAFSLFPGFLYTFTRDLTEILAITFLLAAIVALQRKQGVAVIFLSLAILTKETTLLFAISILISAIIQNKKNWKFFLFPPGVYLIWQIILLMWWGRDQGIWLNNLSLPFMSFIRFAGNIFNKNDIVEQIFISLIIFQAITVLIFIFRFKKPLFITIAWMLYTLLIFSLSNDVWVERVAYLRAMSEWYVLSIIILLHSSKHLQIFSHYTKVRNTAV